MTMRKQGRLGACLIALRDNLSMTCVAVDHETSRNAIDGSMNAMPIDVIDVLHVRASA